ncbi:hypothetical protein PR048_008281 [Dryococelus australis]|uniref:Uncharacterized protein n=1 Tax=Dryococelus australis TaxID=614101 RepID=A0ABQ9HXI1_9NEOP|nr:hypothetical protein PR048_008281 [Dryococelus australis]
MLRADEKHTAVDTSVSLVHVAQMAWCGERLRTRYCGALYPRGIGHLESSSRFGRGDSCRLNVRAMSLRLLQSAVHWPGYILRVMTLNGSGEFLKYNHLQELFGWRLKWTTTPLDDHTSVQWRNKLAMLSFYFILWSSSIPSTLLAYYRTIFFSRLWLYYCNCETLTCQNAATTPGYKLYFPLKICFAMTISEVQGRSLKVAGFYVACYRVGSPSNLIILAPEEGSTSSVVCKDLSSVEEITRLSIRRFDVAISAGKIKPTVPPAAKTEYRSCALRGSDVGRACDGVLRERSSVLKVKNNISSSSSSHLSPSAAGNADARTSRSIVDAVGRRQQAALFSLATAHRNATDHSIVQRRKHRTLIPPCAYERWRVYWVHVVLSFKSLCLEREKKNSCVLMKQPVIQLKVHSYNPLCPDQGDVQARRPDCTTHPPLRELLVHYKFWLIGDVRKHVVHIPDRVYLDP